MRTAVICCLPVLALFLGCHASNTAPSDPSGSAPKTAPPPAEKSAKPLIAQAHVLADQLCACKTSTCRGKVSPRIDEFLMGNKTDLEQVPQEELAEVRARFSTCETNPNVVEEFRAMRTRMCTCVDKWCVEKVNSKFEAWMDANQDARGPKADQDEAKLIADEYMACMSRVLNRKDASATPPAIGHKCGADGACPDGLECLKHVGVPVPRGGEIKSCEKRCGAGQPACGDGLQCTTITEGPGQVCRAKQ